MKIPNIITLARLFLIPIIIYSILYDEIRFAIILFLIAVLSDKLDGYLARKLKQETHQGEIFDALTDTILIFSTITAFYFKDYFSIKFLIIIFSPKIITFLILAAMNKKKFRATIYSRLSSLILYTIIFLLLININFNIIKLLVIVTYTLSILHWFLLIVKR